MKGSSGSSRGGSSWDSPLGSERGSGVGKVSRRADHGAPLSVEKDTPLHLLLVEDSDDDAALVLRELVRSGYVPDCRRVMSQAEFKEALEASSWDAIVSDHSLPGYGGLAALADLRASGRDIPFILVSGSVGEAVAVEAMKAGAQDYVLKQDLTRLPVAIARELRENAIRAEQGEMREQLMISERMASAGMLAAGVAHEINNPLAVAVSNVDYTADVLTGVLAELAALRGRAADGSEQRAEGWSGWERLDQAQEALRDASEGLQRIRDIVLDVKLFSRPLDGNKGPSDIRNVVDSSARMAWNEIRHRARLVKDYGDVPLVEANESRIGQVILNLIVNAAQAIPEGRADANEIRITTKTGEAGWAVVEVSDTGGGIPPQHLERIFDPFFTTKPVGVGTGLGLAVCRRIIDELQGTIGVESEVGKGTVFRVAFPPAPQSRVDPPSKLAAPAQARRLRVLLVDDEVGMGAAVQRGLSRHHEVVFVTQARDALARIEAGERFDVILSDFMMPEMTGMEMHRRLQELAPAQAARVVFLTGGAFTPAGREYLDGFANPIVEKPFKTVDLLTVIATVAGQSTPNHGR
jgi:signal transduction histidine kinase